MTDKHLSQSQKERQQQQQVPEEEGGVFQLESCVCVCVRCDSPPSVPPQSSEPEPSYIWSFCGEPSPVRGQQDLIHPTPKLQGSYTWFLFLGSGSAWI